MANTEDPNVIHREMYERSRDIIRCYNPLDTDFKFKFDSVWYRIPSKGYKDWERYLALKYFHDISEFMIGNMAIEKGEAMLQERRDRGLAEILDKYEENRMIWDKVPRMDNKELLAEIGAKVLVGLVEEFGSEPEPEEFKAPEKRDVPITEQLMGDLTKRRVTDELEEKPVIKPLMKGKLATEVTKE